MVRVLMYHKIVPDGTAGIQDGVELPLSLFRRHIRLLDRWGFTSITFEDYRLSLDEGLELPKRPVIITFDDGYAETYDIAFPVLKEYGMRAVVFVLGDRTMLANDWDLPLGIPPSPLMNDSQILEMHAAGFEIGSHSMTHPHLARLSREEVWDQVSRSRMRLEIMLNSPVQTFAYPYGELNGLVKSLVTEAGYRFACGSWSGPPVALSDHYEIRRALIVANDGPVRMAFKVIAPYRHYRWLWWKFKSAILRDLTPVRVKP
ncbi:MAG TPA: polysaccharide deacetylase family protein [Bacteroidota bacterium]|nr:polysaccharide deacetylase family protein [Bacteroidota bacterium]